MPSCSGRLVVVEAPNLLDVLERRGEAGVFSAAMGLIGWQVCTFTVRSEAELVAACDYIREVDNSEEEKLRQSGQPQVPLVVHVSCHGMKQAVAMGSDVLSWAQLGEAIRAVGQIKYYAGPVVLSLSSCQASEQTLTAWWEKSARGRGLKPPALVFATRGDVSWAGSIVAWMGLYLRLGTDRLEDMPTLRETLGAVAKVSGVVIDAHQWDGRAGKFVKHVETGRVAFMLGGLAFMAGRGHGGQSGEGTMNQGTEE